jgi:zinc transport system permease protein
VILQNTLKTRCRALWRLALCALLALFLSGASVQAQGVNPEDEAIPDVVAPLPTATRQTALDEHHDHPSASTDSDQHQHTETAPESTAAGAWPPFMYQALYAGLLVAIMCSFLGLYVVLKRIVFVGVALSELSSAGIAMALFMGISPLLGSIVCTLLGVGLFSVRWSPRRVPHESSIGAVYCIAGALAVLLMAKDVHGESHMLKLMQGDVLTVDPHETLQMLIAFAVVATLHALFAKEFMFVSFDRDSATTLGFRATWWDFLLFLTLGIVISFSIRATGVLLTSTMLILPAVTALLLTKRWKIAVLLAPLLGVLPLVGGLYFSYIVDVPASAMVVALSFLLLLPALALYAFRGER